VSYIEHGGMVRPDLKATYSKGQTVDMEGTHTEEGNLMVSLAEFTVESLWMKKEDISLDLI